MKYHSFPPKYLLSAPHKTSSQCWISGLFYATNTSSLRCSVAILCPSMLWCFSLLPIDSTVDSMAPLTHAVTMHCNRSGILSYKAVSKQNMLMIFKFSGLWTITSWQSLCKNWWTCFKNEVSDISCFINPSCIELQTRNFFLPIPWLQRLPLLAYW